MKCCKIFNFFSLILQFPITNNIFRSENTEIRSENVENRNLNFKSFSDRKIRKKPENRKFSVSGAVRKLVFPKKIDPCEGVTRSDAGEWSHADIERSAVSSPPRAVLTL